MALKCPRCNQEWTFDNEHIGKNGRKIPLDPLTKTPHDCPMREKILSTPYIGENTTTLTFSPKEDKNDHGNEEFKPIDINGEIPIGQKFVDHTLKPDLKLKILVDPTAEGLAKQYNSFEKPIKFSQYQLAPSLYTIAVYYEDNGK